MRKVYILMGLIVYCNKEMKKMECDITYACGHTGTAHIVGSQKTVDWLIQNKQKELCQECYQAQFSRDARHQNDL